MSNIPLHSLKVGGVGYVTHVMGNKGVKKAMQNAGFFAGSKIVVLNISPYKGNYLLDVNGRVMAFRKGAVCLVYVN